MAKEWTIENTSGQFVSVKVRDAAGNIVKAVGFPPHSGKPVRNIFRKPDNSPDSDACLANDDVRQHIESGRIRVYEKQVESKVPNVGPLFNETDPEEERVRKILEHRRKVKGKNRQVTMPPPAVDKADKPTKSRKE